MDMRSPLTNHRLLLLSKTINNLPDNSNFSNAQRINTPVNHNVARVSVLYAISLWAFYQKILNNAQMGGERGEGSEPDGGMMEISETTTTTPIGNYIPWCTIIKILSFENVVLKILESAKRHSGKREEESEEGRENGKAQR